MAVSESGWAPSSCRSMRRRVAERGSLKSHVVVELQNPDPERHLSWGTGRDSHAENPAWPDGHNQRKISRGGRGAGSGTYQTRERKATEPWRQRMKA
jgi:hypothetical protein